MQQQQSSKKFSQRKCVFDSAQWLSESVGISFSEALGYVLGVKDVYYGWELNLSEEEFQALIDNSDAPIDNGTNIDAEDFPF